MNKVILLMVADAVLQARYVRAMARESWAREMGPALRRIGANREVLSMLAREAA